MDDNGQIDRLVRLSEVLTMLGVGRSTIYRLLEAEQFQTPVKVGTKAVRWRMSDLQNWISTRPKANP